MPEIAVIGAGGIGLPLQLIGDILSYPELRDSSPALMNLDARRNDRTATAAGELAEHYHFPTPGFERRRRLEGVIRTERKLDEDAHRDSGTLLPGLR